MKTTFALSTLATLAAALPAPQADTTTTPSRFGGIAIRSGSPIHFHSLNANNQAFWINKNTTTYCPTDSAAASACGSANTNETLFSYLASAETLGLATQVPGGQQVYVTAGDESRGQLAGQLKFTQAHSAATSGPALYEGFEIVTETRLQFEGLDWFACPLGEGTDAYGIWAESRLRGVNAGEGCLGFIWTTSQVTDDTVSAWQYV